MDWITTSTVLASLRDFQNCAAWDQFVRRFRDPVYRFARSTGLPEGDAEDVVQETLVAFAEAFRRDQYDRSKGRLSQWLFGIAYRKAMNERRQSVRRPACPPSSQAQWLDAAVADEASLMASWDQEWEQSLLEQCLEQVRREVEPVTFNAFELAVRKNLPAAQAAEALGVPIKLIYNAKHRVLRRIRELRAEIEEIF